MKIATWNVNSLKVRLPQVLEWLAAQGPDVLCLQELKLEDKAFPLAEIEAAGYRAAFSGQKTYNGVAILSRGEPRDVERGIAEREYLIWAGLLSAKFSVSHFCKWKARNHAQVFADRDANEFFSPAFYFRKCVPVAAGLHNKIIARSRIVNHQHAKHASVGECAYSE